LLKAQRLFCGIILALTLCPTSSPAQQTAAMQIDHVAIYVSDLKTSVAFYQTVFGFERVPMPVSFAAWLSMGHGVLLHIVGGRKEPVSNSKWDHIAIACDDMDKMTASLDAKHIPWASIDGKSAPAVRFDGVKQIFIKDPDGYWIEINDALKKQR
jgi:lactoylglutathione lyase